MTNRNILVRPFDAIDPTINDQRVIVGILAIILPVLTLVYGLVSHLLMPTISEYYYTGARDAFEGTLCVTGFFLVTYKGPYLREAVLTTLCGIAGLLVALFPCFTAVAITPPLPARVGLLNLPVMMSNTGHVTSAACFFILLGVNCIAFCFDDPVGTNVPSGRMSGETTAARVVYLVCAALIFGSVIALAILSKWPASEEGIWRWFCETVALVAFSVSWFTKGKAIQRLVNFGKTNLLGMKS
jgi:hypothetical protein